MGKVEREKTRSSSGDSGEHPDSLNISRLLVSSSPVAPLKLPLWARLLLKLPCPKFPSRLSNWTGLFTSMGVMIFLVLFWFFEFWLIAKASLAVSFVPLRWLIVLAVPIAVAVFWLRIELQRTINSLETLRHSS